jgi:serine/threonine-protein kinase
MSLDAAREEVGDDFRIEVAKSVDGESPVDTILGQDPGPGKAEKGSTISVDVVGTQVKEVPGVAGSARAEAEQALRAAGFEVEVDERESSFENQNRIMSQNPSGGTRSEVGSAVTITVGTGPSSVPVPRLYGRTPAQAESVLQGAGLTLGAQSRDYSSEVAEGSIFFQNLSVGANVEPGTAVDVTVSLGPEQVEVPEVYGLSLAAARAALSNAGLDSTAIEVEGDEAAGTALSTDPGVGAMLDPGSTVSLYYSAGPPPTTTASPDASSAPDASSNPERSQGPDRQARDERNSGAQPDDNQPADRPQRNERTTPDNSGSGSSGQGSSGQGNSGPGSGGGSGSQEGLGPAPEE